MASTNNLNIKQHKRRLIAERIDTDPVAKRGMSVSRLMLLALLFLRGALFVFEIVYYGIVNLEVNAVSNLLLIPLLIMIYMIYDGNKALSAILGISAIVRAVWLFTSVYPALPEGGAANAYIGAYLAVMLYQFIAMVLISVYAPAISYFDKMQTINMELSTLLRGASASANRRK